MYNIVYINKSVEIGGSEISLFLLLKHLDRETYNPIVVLPCGGPFYEQLYRIGVKVITTPLHNISLRGGNPLLYLSTVYRLVKIIRREKAHLIHSNNDSTNQYGAVAAKMSGVPIVCHIRDMNTKKSINRSFLFLTDKLIANSKAVAESYFQCKGRTDKVEVIYNGISIRDLSLDLRPGLQFRNRFKIPTGKFLIGIVGRIIPDKGHHVLIEALSKIHERCDDFHLVVVGHSDTTQNLPYHLDGHYFHRLKESIAYLNLSNHVTFTGFIDNIAEVHNALDVLVLPSFREPFGRVLLEAMAAGRPVIASAIGGPLEVVEDSVTGLLVPPGDPQRLADAILTLACDREMARQMGKEGRKRVERLFTIQQNVAKTEALYRQVLGHYDISA